MSAKGFVLLFSAAIFFSLNFSLAEENNGSELSDNLDQLKHVIETIEEMKGICREGESKGKAEGKAKGSRKKRAIGVKNDNMFGKLTVMKLKMKVVLDQDFNMTEVEEECNKVVKNCQTKFKGILTLLKPPKLSQLRTILDAETNMTKVRMVKQMAKECKRKVMVAIAEKLELTPEDFPKKPRKQFCRFFKEMEMCQNDGDETTTNPTEFPFPVHTIGTETNPTSSETTSSTTPEPVYDGEFAGEATTAESTTSLSTEASTSSAVPTTIIKTTTAETAGTTITTTESTTLTSVEETTTASSESLPVYDVLDQEEQILNGAMNIVLDQGDELLNNHEHVDGDEREEGEQTRLLRRAFEMLHMIMSILASLSSKLIEYISKSLRPT